MNATLARMKSDKANDNVLNEVIKIIEKRAISGEYNVSVNINISCIMDLFDDAKRRYEMYMNGEDIIAS